MGPSGSISDTSGALAASQMNTLCKTIGVQIGDIRVPAFTLRRSEWLVLRWPDNFGSFSEDQFYKAISGSSGCEFILNAKSNVVTLFGKQADELFAGRTIGKLLAALSTTDRNRLEAEIETRRLSAETSVNDLPLTSRLLTGLMLASHTGEIVIFNTSGLDPKGVQSVYAYVGEKMKLGISFIELEFQGSDKNQPHPVAVVRLEATR
jgi:hypothetical protein